jgi:integration host factor subunit beta
MVVCYGDFAMIKSDLVWRIWHENPHLHREEVETIVYAILDEMTATLARGDRVELRGFGTSSVKIREAHTGRNPRTGVLVSVPKKASPHFKAGLEIRDRLNRREE